MQIQAILGLKPQDIPVYKIKQDSNNTVNTEEKPMLNQTFPIGYAKINFRGKTDPMTKLWEEYNWYIRNDKTPAIFSFLKIKEAPEVMEKFFNTILESSDRAHELLSSIAYNPRKTIEINKGLRKVLPSESLNLMPFRFDSPYNKAYTKFVDWKYDTAKSVEDLFKMRPDWRGEAIIEKYKQLRPNEMLEIGNVPKDIPKNHLDQIVEYLSNYVEYGVKSEKNIDSLKIGNRTYDFKFFTEGKSDKNVFGVFTPEGKKYVIKKSDPMYRSLDDPFALGTLAKIDSYLTYNRSRNSAPFCYYNHDKNYSVYKYIEHVPTEDYISSLSEVKEKLPDFKALGLTYNDTVGYKNFFMMHSRSNQALHGTEGLETGIKQKEWVSVDNDHVTYNNPLQPLVGNKVTSLPNGMQQFF